MSLVVVCDASPLIFLAKIDRLELIRKIAGDEVVVLRCVCDEILSDRGGPSELGRLKNFLESVRIEEIVTDRSVGNQLSLTDRSSLVWAIKNGAQRLLADEALLRRVAKAEGLEVVGVIGLLIQAMKEGLLTKGEALKDLEDLISRDELRISLGLYRRILGLLKEGGEI